MNLKTDLSKLKEKTTEEIDKLYVQGKIESKILWKILRDKFYRELFFSTNSQEALAEAGFFDDETKAGYFKEVANPNWFTTPVHKIRKNLKGGTQNAVLLTTGGFSPLHEGHLEMMAVAKKEIEARGFNVVGGYISPGHDKYVSQKYNGSAAKPIAERLRFCELAVQESSWIMVDPWEGLYNSHSINFTDVYSRLETYLKKHFADDDITLFYVFGGDNAGFVRAFEKHGQCVCVQRGEITDKWNKFKGMIAEPERQLFVECEHNYSEYSSKKIREGLIKSQLSAEERNASLPYVIRNDYDWAAKIFPSKAPIEAEFKFVERLKELLSIRVNEGAKLKVEVYELSEQAKYFEKLHKKHKILNLDICSKGDFNISLSRVFELSGSQIYSDRMEARPGYPNVEQQFLSIPPGDYILLEDDVASGRTVKMVKSMLPEGVKITGIKTLSEHSFARLRDKKEKYKIYDIVDCRDFLVGSKDGGLVVELPNGSIARAPYMQPYVNLVSRAKVDPGLERSLSLGLWGMNIAFYSQYYPDMTLGEADPSFKKLMNYVGFSDHDKMVNVCAWHFKRLMR